MCNRSRYWIAVRLDRLGRCHTEAIEAARGFVEQQFAVAALDRQIQRQLVKWLCDGDECQPLAEQCLRCFISHEIRQVCLALEQQFGRYHDFSSAELLPYVLDSVDNDAPSVSETADESVAFSLTDRILATFDPDKSNLSTWTARMVRSDRSVRRFLLEHGIELMSDWLMLCQRSPGSLQRLLSEFYGQTPVEVERAVHLLEGFHQIYRASLVQQRQQRGRSQPYPPPTRVQLQQLAVWLADTPTPSPEALLPELQMLAKLIRTYRIQAREGRFSPTVANCGETLAEREEIEVLLVPYLCPCLAQAVAQTTRVRVAAIAGKRGRKAQQYAQQKSQQFLQALHLFHCQGLAMGDIAAQLGVKGQSQISRLLGLKEFRADVGRRLLQCLSDRIQDLAQQYCTSERLHDLDRKIADFLTQQIDRILSEDQKRATANKDRLRPSQLSQTLCRYLDTEFDLRRGNQG